jgi:hypothetical protein
MKLVSLRLLVASVSCVVADRWKDRVPAGAQPHSGDRRGAAWSGPARDLGIHRIHHGVAGVAYDLHHMQRL